MLPRTHGRLVQLLLRLFAFTFGSLQWNKAGPPAAHGPRGFRWDSASPSTEGCWQSRTEHSGAQRFPPRALGILSQEGLGGYHNGERKASGQIAAESRLGQRQNLSRGRTHPRSFLISSGQGRVFMLHKRPRKARDCRGPGAAFRGSGWGSQLLHQLRRCDLPPQGTWSQRHMPWRPPLPRRAAQEMTSLPCLRTAGRGSIWEHGSLPSYLCSAGRSSRAHSPAPSWTLPAALAQALGHGHLAIHKLHRSQLQSVPQPCSSGLTGAVHPGSPVSPPPRSPAPCPRVLLGPQLLTPCSLGLQLMGTS